MVIVLAEVGSSQTETAAAQRVQPAARTASSAIADLYRQLGRVPLDPNAVYKIRDAAIDREDIHFSFHDGTIAFTRTVDGRVTGALFEGEGEVLIVPPDYTERHSLSLFTKVAVLSERFSLAYFRFADDTVISTLQPYLRAPDDAAGFIQKHDALALTLADADSLRTLIGLTYSPQASAQDYAGEFFYARINGEKLGSFEVFFDPLGVEQISARQLSFTPRGRFYDLWMSFPMRSVRKARTAGLAVATPSKVVEITDYKVRMDVRPPTDLAGSATLTLRAAQTGVRAVLFELSRYLKLSSVEWEGQGGPPVNLDFIQNEALEGSQLASRGNDTVTIIFPRPLTAGQTLQVRFNYAGSVMSEAGGGLLYVGARGTWYPNRGAAMSNFDLEFRHPAEWKLLATGKRMASTVKDGFEEAHFVSEHPVPLAGFNLGKYVNTPFTAGTTKLDVYSARGMETDFQRANPLPANPFPTRPGTRPMAPPPLPPRPDPSKNAGKVGRNATAMIEFLSPRIGPFPFSGLSITQLPGPNSQGWPGLVFLSSYVFLDRTERERGRFTADIHDWVFDHSMTEHEVAHQWWGNHVFWESYRDQWLMEALSNYCALLKLERDDPATVRKLMDYYRDSLLQKPASGDERPYGEAGPVRLGVRLNSSRFSGAYDPVIYGRGTWLLHMLREMLKDAARSPSRPAPKKGTPAAPANADPDAIFFSALRDLQTRFAGKTMNTNDFLAAFENALPAAANFEKRRSLDWFYTGWINGSAIPKITLDNVRMTISGGRTVATGVIVQHDAPELLVTSVPVYAVAGNAAPVFVGRIFADGERTDFRLMVPVGSKRLELDPHFTVLRQP